jgi:hypothetical protein
MMLAAGADIEAGLGRNIDPTGKIARSIHAFE